MGGSAEVLKSLALSLRDILMAAEAIKNPIGRDWTLRQTGICRCKSCKEVDITSKKRGKAWSGVPTWRAELGSAGKYDGAALRRIRARTHNYLGEVQR